MRQELPIWAVVLAAGQSRRMGRIKQLLPLGKRTMLERVLDSLLAASVSQIIVVLGFHAEEILAGTRKLDHPEVRIVYNHQPHLDMFSSLQAGVSAFEPGVAAFVLALADQPRIEPAVVNALIATYRRTGKGIVKPSFGGRRGHPILLDGKYRDEILSAPSTGTLHDILSRYRDDTAQVEVESRYIHDDIDSDIEYQAVLREVEDR